MAYMYVNITLSSLIISSADRPYCGYLTNTNICIPFVQRRPNVFDAASTLYECYTHVLCLLNNSLDTRGLLTLSILQEIIQLIVILLF